MHGYRRNSIKEVIGVVDVNEEVTNPFLGMTSDGLQELIQYFDFFFLILRSRPMKRLPLHDS